MALDGTYQVDVLDLRDPTQLDPTTELILLFELDRTYRTWSSSRQGHDIFLM